MRKNAGLLRPRFEDPDLRRLAELAGQRLVRHAVLEQIRKCRASSEAGKRLFADTLLANAQLMPEGDPFWRKMYSRDQVDTFLVHLQEARPEVDTYKLDEDDMASIYRLDKVSRRLAQPDLSADPMSSHLRERTAKITDDVIAGTSSKRAVREVATLAEGVVAALSDQEEAAKVLEVGNSLEAHRRLAMIQGQASASPTLCVSSSDWIIEALNIRDRVTDAKGCYSMSAQTAVVTTEAAEILRRVRYYEPLLHEEIHAAQDNELTEAEMKALRGKEGHIEMAINEAVTQGLTLRKLARENIDTSESIAYIEQMIVIEALSGMTDEQQTEAFLEELALTPRRHRVARMAEHVFGASDEESKEKFIEIGTKLLDDMNAVGYDVKDPPSAAGWDKRCLRLKKEKEKHKEILRQRLDQQLQTA